MSKRKNKILPAALATTLAFGAAPFAVSADVDLETIDDTYPATAEWTETDWNTYLENNYGTNLSEYASNEELFNELGEPVDINAWISDQSDANILDTMERYGITGDELAAILQNNDNLENIHFVGDLENVLQDEGFTEVSTGTEEPAVSEEEPAEDPIDDELADAEVYNEDVVEGEDAVDEATADTTEETTTTEEPAAEETTPDEEVAEEVAVDQSLNDENLSATLYMYDLTEDEYNTFLEENGYTEADFATVADLEVALEDAGYTVVNVVEGEEMPDTATNSVQNALIGTGIALLGAAAFFTTRRREGEQ